MGDQPLPTTPTSGRIRHTRSVTPKTPLRPSPTPHQPKYSHPYGIKSTSSGVLSSAAVSSSPNNAVSAHSYQQHKSSKSMQSSLRNSSSAHDLASSASIGSVSAASPGIPRNAPLDRTMLTGSKYDSIRTRKRTLAQRASMSDLSTMARESPGGRELENLMSPRRKVTELREEWAKAGVIRGEGTGSRGSGRPGVEAWQEELEKLPKNPRKWTTAELATFVSLTLKHDTPSDDSATPLNTPLEEVGFGLSATTPSKVNRGAHYRLPSAVIEDIKAWIYRRRLDGKAFIRSGEGGWAVSEKPPPFLPILLSPSRNLRRATLKTRPSVREFSSSFEHAEDPSAHHPGDSAYHRHFRDSSVLQETDENADAEQLALELSDHVDDLSHVRHIVNNFDRRLFSPFEPLSLGDHPYDVLSRPDVRRHKSRTMSLSSSHSAASLLSSDTNDSISVSERAALFESGALARHGNKTAEEREGHVLDQQFCGEVDAIRHVRASQETEEEEDVFGATYRSGMMDASSGSTGGSYDASSRLPSLVPGAEIVPTFAGPEVSEEVPYGADLPELPGHIVAHSFPEVDFSSTNHAYGTTDAPVAANPACAEVGPSVKDSAPSVFDAGDHPPVPLHMSHMDEHEKAGLKPYGALRRAHSTPVPRICRKRTVELANDIFSPKPVPGTSTMPHNATGYFEWYHDGKDVTTRHEVGDSHTIPHVSYTFPNPSTYPVDTQASARSWSEADVLQETRERLTIAQARIGDLERALAEVVEEKATLLQSLTSAEKESVAANEFDKPVNPSSDEADTDKKGLGTASITALWRWVAAGQLLSPSTGPFGPPETFGQIPGYVFLVGVGLSVIVARVVFSRPMSQGRS